MRLHKQPARQNPELGPLKGIYIYICVYIYIGIYIYICGLGSKYPIIGYLGLGNSDYGTGFG